MAIHTVNDSAGWDSIWVKEVQTDAAGVVKATALANHPVDSFFQVGAKAGLVIDTVRMGEDTAWYATVDMAARIRVDAFAAAATDGQPVYWTGTAITLTVSTNVRVGFVDMPGGKAAVSGPLFVQLTPQSA